MPAGRPTKWKDEFCEMLIEHMANGYSFASFGGIIDVSEDTLHTWKNEKPQFSESYKAGRLKSMAFWEKIGIGQSVGKLKGSSQTWTFNMKNRFGWQDKQHIETEQKQRLVIDMGENEDEQEN